MSDRIRNGVWAALFCLAATVLLPATALAEEAPEGWEGRATLYGWFPSIGGALSFPGGSSGPSIQADASDIIGNLNFTLMGTFEARKGKFGLWTDLIYLDVGGSGSESRQFTVGGQEVPGDVRFDAELNITSWIVTAAGTYLLDRTPRNEIAFVMGVRTLSLDQTLDWKASGNIGSIGLPGRSGSADAGATNWDAIVGLKGLATLSKSGHWILPYYVDVGAGESDLTWKAFAAIGYRFTWGATTLGWSYLDYEFDTDGSLLDLSANGPFAGLTFFW